MSETIDERIDLILLAHVDIDHSYSDESGFVDDLGFDSLDVADLVVDAETTFEIDLRDQEIEDIRTVGDLRRLIKQKAA